MTKFFLFLISFLLFPTFYNAQDWPIKGTPAWPNDKDFNDTCEAIPFGVDFGFCSMALGWALTDSGCVMLSGCSWVGSDGIDYTSSFFGSLDACNSACLQCFTESKQWILYYRKATDWQRYSNFQFNWRSHIRNHFR